MNQDNNIEYFIIKEQYYNKKGKPEELRYFIRFRKSFLFIKYWKYITFMDCSWGDYERRKIEFSSYEEAETFICDILCKNKPYNKHALTIEGKITCSTCGCALTK